MLLLIGLQGVLIVALLISNVTTYHFGVLTWALSIAILIPTVLLLIHILRTRNKLREIADGLKRACKGNLKTRLFSSGDRLLDEIIFSLNELIEQLEKVQIETIQAREARTRLLSSISHDIRTPLTSILGYIDALRDGIAATEEEKQEYLAILSHKASNLKQLIDEIFTMARLDADEFILKVETLDLAEVIREVIIEFLPVLKKHTMEVKVNLPEEKRCTVQADRLSIMRIIRNIMKNALLYGQEGKIIGVELIEHPHTYHVLIWDRGPGLTKGEIANVFERMYRSNKARTPFAEGSGLGLAIARALVEKHQGTIWVESVPWEKTTFGFSLPKPNISK
uniref:histidine kinase n=1 Tax=Thermosporothrix sp. COM3 TaxID=2490863 RepID=A0A455SG29_9CHLR|nr:two-component sensor histidine kinase [Thermosporothrix sp. COM3]